MVSSDRKSRLDEMHTNPSMAYRPDIDGLRAVAILTVIGYHAFPQWVPAGYVGVDVFFVISGFLITTIIAREHSAGRFSLAGFYARRIRRLFPALILVLAATWLLGWFFLLPHEFKALGKHMAAAAAYFINFTLKKEAGYFDAAAEDKPLLHLWSLAVEEQFYIVWPLLLLLLVRRPQHLLVALTLITGASFAASLEAVGRNAASAFYLPQNRVWELATGALLALLSLDASYRPAWLHRPQLGEKATQIVTGALSCAGLLLIIGATFLLGAGIIYPGAWAAIPVTGAVFVIGAGPKAAPNRLFLSRRGMIFIGLISYSLYLWHWPLLSFRSILGVPEDAAISLFIVAVAAMLAIATYMFVERPLRRTPNVRLPAALAGGAVSLLLVGALSYQGLISPRLNSFELAQIGAATSDWQYPDGLERVNTPNGLRIHTTEGGGDAVLYFGDSNVEQYWPRVEQLLHEMPTPRRVIFATGPACPPIPKVHEKSRPACNGFAEKSLKLAASADVGTVVVAASWIAYFNNSPYYVDEEGGGPLKVGSDAWNRAFDLLSTSLRDLVASGKDVWLVLNIPSSPKLAALESLHRSLTGGTFAVPLNLDRPAFDATWKPIKTKLIKAARSAGARVIDPMASLCDSQKCPGQTDDGAPIYTDGGHLRASFVRDHATYIDPTLRLQTGSTR